MADNKNDETEFDDDFSDIDFDESTLEDDNEFAELSPDDVEDTDFESEEWQDDEQPQTTGKKGKNDLYTSGEKKGLSFNTMVIVGAVVLGAGVMVFTVMNKTAEQQAGQKSVFQSIMGMAGVMDGVLSGEKENTPTEEDVIAQEQKTQNEGFLNNPDAANPPQPAPIAPAENEPLTPLPDTAAETPRGPDEAPPSFAPDTTVADGAEQVPVVPMAPKSDAAPSDAAGEPAQASGGSAEDILKKALANREQKTQDRETPAAGEQKTATADVPAEAEDVTPAPEVSTPAIEPPAAVEMNPPVQAPAQIPVKTANETAPAVVANTEAVQALETKIDALLKRMDQIESDLGSVKSTKSSDYKEIEETVSSLKQDVAAIKERPAPKTERPRAVEAPVSVTEDDQMVEDAKPAPVKKKAVRKSVTASAAKPAATGRWELRAAQPGRAWISKPGERDMQSVEIGQTVAGIGTISAITYQNGRWTVQGSQGQINQ